MATSEADRAHAYMQEAFAKVEVQREGDRFGLVDFVVGLRQATRKQAARYLSKSVYQLPGLDLAKEGHKQSMATVDSLRAVAKTIGNEASEKFLAFMSVGDTSQMDSEPDVDAGKLEYGSRMSDWDDAHLLQRPDANTPEEVRKAYDSWFMEEPFDDLVHRLAGTRFSAHMLTRMGDLVTRKHRFLCWYGPMVYAKRDGKVVLGLSRKSADWVVPFLRARIKTYPFF